MRLFLLLMLAALFGGTVSAGAMHLTSRYGTMPYSWARWAHVATGPTHSSNADSLAGLYGQVASVPMPKGGPQALEGYTYLEHSHGLVKRAIGTIGNVEVAAQGDTDTVRGMQAGVVVSGPGNVGLATSLYLAQARRRSDYQGSTHVERVDYITFDNGWSIRPDREHLLLCDPQGVCRRLG
jgi:hypothetical protein